MFFSKSNKKIGWFIDSLYWGNNQLKFFISWSCSSRLYIDIHIEYRRYLIDIFLVCNLFLLINQNNSVEIPEFETLFFNNNYKDVVWQEGSHMVYLIISIPFMNIVAMLLKCSQFHICRCLLVCAWRAKWVWVVVHCSDCACSIQQHCSLSSTYWITLDRKGQHWARNTTRDSNTNSGSDIPDLPLFFSYHIKHWRKNIRILRKNFFKCLFC